MIMSLTAHAWFVCAAEPKLKEPKAQTKEWFDPKESHANTHELLFFALLLLSDAVGCVSELEAWATKVRKEKAAAESLREHWKPSEAWPLKKGPGQVSTLFDRMERAYTNVNDSERLDNIGSVMQQWDGIGRYDGLKASHLRNHTLRPKGKALVAVRDKPKGHPPPRWRAWTIVGVAEIVLVHGIELRKLLKLHANIAEVPTAHERAITAEARVEVLEAERNTARSERDLAQNRARKATLRSAEGVEKKRAAVRAVKAAVKQAAEAKLAKRIEAANARAKRQREEAAKSLAKEITIAKRQATAATKKAAKAVAKSEASLAAAIENVEQQYADSYEDLRVSKNRAHAQKRKQGMEQDGTNQSQTTKGREGSQGAARGVGR